MYAMGSVFWSVQFEMRASSSNGMQSRASDVGQVEANVRDRARRARTVAERSVLSAGRS